MSGPLPRLPRWLAALLLVLALAGCAGVRAPEATAVRPDVGALDRSVAALNATRGVVLAEAADLIGAAAGLDRSDGQAAAGDSAGLATSYAAGHAGAARVEAVLASSAGHLSAYAEALDQLGQALQAAGYSPAQRQALAAVVASGQAERRSLDALRAAVAAGWPAYAGLDTSIRTWLERATAGWYRSGPEAANAYAVLTGSGRSALEAARASLAAVDAARADAAGGMTSALRSARDATTGLR